MDSTIPIPARLNRVLSVGVSAILLSAAWLARDASGIALAGAIVLFALGFQTNFALFHEAAHQKLQPTTRSNYVWGQLAGLAFGMSMTMFTITHGAHHQKNRTDAEAFDLILPGESAWRKRIGWFGMLIGLWYWLIPVANLLFLSSPTRYRRVAERLRLTEGLFRRSDETLRRIRSEIAVVIAVMLSGLWLLGPERWLLLYLPATFLWSTLQYVEHAYAPRHVIDGAFNLDAPAPLALLQLHRELDLNHHRHPSVPWIHLPALSRPDDARPSYVAHYFRQWRGPVRSTEPGPPPLADQD